MLFPKMNAINLGDAFKVNLDELTLFLIQRIGMPSIIAYNEYIYKEVALEVNFLIIGQVKGSEQHKVGINLESGEIMHCWNFKDKAPEYVFVNSSLKQLLLCSFSYDFFIRRLIASNLLGEYHYHHKKYADLLSQIINDIDEKAVSSGAWSNLIEEMSLGVI